MKGTPGALEASRGPNDGAVARVDVTGGAASSTRRLRILWLIKGLGAGGAERLLCNAAEARDRTAFACEVAYLLPWKSALAGELEALGVPVTCLRGGKEWDLRWALRLRRMLVRRPVDVVHVHSPYVAGIARLVVRSLPPRRRPRLVYTEHLPWSGYVWPTRLLNAATFALDDAHVAVSRAARDAVPRWLRGRLHVVVHGIQLDRVRAQRDSRHEARRELGVSDSDILVGTVGNVRPQKRYPDLLAAARLAMDADASVRFAAAGSGSDEPEIVRLHGELGLGDRFRFLGYVEDAARFLSACDLFVLASEYEGLPVALMEALALGLPVVATAVPGIAGEVRDGIEASLVPVGRPDLLADAIVSLAGAPGKRAERAEASRARAERYDLDDAVRRLEGLYRDVSYRS